ncbi:MAG: neutral/alkaline non-lysosomal ceramidase N-terminal domain-containing protein [Planctomycetes bacterium]|nr:neutral/alkaline non-lysosomal ceramidase N-terminal domain-containing protein [Planctomycetota bacterium]
MRVCLSLALLFVASLTFAAEEAAPWRAGVARTIVTPTEPMYLAGFGSRVVPSEGTAMELGAKALALQDTGGRRFVLVTMDLLDVPRQLRDALEQYVAEKHKLPREALLINCSHTHCGPEMCYTEVEFAERDPERVARCRRFNQTLHDKLAAIIDESLANLAPARLAYGHARCGFAMNRRLKSDSPQGDPYLNRPNPDGPVDHDVPVLKLERPDGSLLAVALGYACHNTTLNLKQYHGDYAGHAQAMIEAAHPGTTALFVTGCGADQNGYPRSKPEFSEYHGRALATALEAKSRPINGPLRMAYDTAPIAYQAPPTVERLRARLETGSEYAASYKQYDRSWDERRLRLLEAGNVPTSYLAPVQVVRFGDDLTLIGISGETVVDYSLRLKRELAGPAAVWVAGYCNDVFTYLPSKRVLLEGGYEAERALTLSTNPVHPAPFDASVEATVIGTTHRLLAETRSQTTASSPPRSPGAATPSTTASAGRPQGVALSDAEALDGWLALFDGRSTFGWVGAQLAGNESQRSLRGGRTTTRFTCYRLAALVEQPGTIHCGVEVRRVKPGWTVFTVESLLPGAIELADGAAVSALHLLPTQMKPLFNGKDLRGWDRREYASAPPERRANWSVENGAIRARGGPGALEFAPTNENNLFGDFLIQVTACANKDNTNGGLFLRNEPGRTMMGYEAQLHNAWYDHAHNERGYTTGGIDDRQQARQPVARDHVPYRMTVVADGPHLATWVNGQQQTDWTDTRPPHANPRQGLRVEPGTIQLQAHDPETDLEFRAILLQAW